MPIGPLFTGDGGGNGIVNLGGLPGIQQGLFAARPAAGVADGVWYLATDTKVLYRWDLGTTTWVEELSDGGGVTPNLQQVTDVGAITNDDTTFGDAGAQFLIQGTAGLIFNKAGATVHGVWGPNDIVVYGDTNYFIELFSNGTTQYLVFENAGNRMRVRTAATISADRFFTMPDANSVSIVPIGFNFNGVNLATSYNIAHGLAFTPDTATITPLNAASATLLAGGYWLTYTSTNIVLHLVVATVGTPALSFSFHITQ